MAPQARGRTRQASARRLKQHATLRFLVCSALPRLLRDVQLLVGIFSGACRVYLTLRIHRWRSSRQGAQLADPSVVMAQSERSGRQPKSGERIRGFVLAHFRSSRAAPFATCRGGRHEVIPHIAGSLRRDRQVGLRSVQHRSSAEHSACFQARAGAVPSKPISHTSSKDGRKVCSRSPVP